MALAKPHCSNCCLESLSAIAAMSKSIRRYGSPISIKPVIRCARKTRYGKRSRRKGATALWCKASSAMSPLMPKTFCLNRISSGRRWPRSSGGERNRLTLAIALAQSTDVLVLDEPTNDLDMQTLDLLEDMLLNFEGTLILVSHDRAFLDATVTSCLVPLGRRRMGRNRQAAGPMPSHRSKANPAKPQKPTKSQKRASRNRQSRRSKPS